MRISDWSSDVCSSDLLGVEVEQLFQPFGVVLEAPPDIDAFQHLVVALVGFAKIGGHLFRGVEVGDGGREMRLAGQQTGLSAAGEIDLVLFGQRGAREGVVNNGIPVASYIAKPSCNGFRPTASERKCAV